MDTATQTAEVPRKKIPREMWETIRAVEHAHNDPLRKTFASMREELITMCGKYGFSETELIRRGIITPRQKPNPTPAGEKP
jgi:hypothetical protein